MEGKYNPLGREPDVDTPAFMIWKKKEGDPDNLSPLITINDGEEIHESRLYRAIVVPGYELLILAKKRKDSYWFAVKGKGPDGKTFIKTTEKGPMNFRDYQNEISKLEALFSGLFDVENPQITPGRHYMTYLKKNSSR